MSKKSRRKRIETAIVPIIMELKRTIKMRSHILIVNKRAAVTITVVTKTKFLMKTICTRTATQTIIAMKAQFRVKIVDQSEKEVILHWICNKCNMHAPLWNSRKYIYIYIYI